MTTILICSDQARVRDGVRELFVRCAVPAGEPGPGEAEGGARGGEGAQREE